MCRCDCGNEKKVRQQHLGRAVFSCGCLKAERASETTTTHGQSSNKMRQSGFSHEYRAWRAMRQRCLNPDADNRAYYGGLGVTICPRWDDFAAFLEDVGTAPTKECSLDRFPNNEGNYEPGNVRWATKKEQGRNMRSNVKITLSGKTMVLAEWCELFGVTESMYRSRRRRGLTAEQALIETVCSPRRQV